MRLFFAAGCPYAQRTRALLQAIKQPYDAVPVDLANKPADFLAISPTGAVPLLDDEGFTLFESSVVNEYLAEKYAWAPAFPEGARERALHRLAMKRFDDVLVPLYFRALKEPGAPAAHATWRRELAFIASVANTAAPRSLLGLHMATHWLRMTWLKPDAEVVMALREAAGAFLDAAAALPEVVATSPDREVTVADMTRRFL